MPAALLLDFGGVIADAPQPRIPPPDLVLKIYNLTRGALTPGEIQRRLNEADAAYAGWRDEDHPDEMPQSEVWERFVLRGWSRSVQASVRGQIPKLSYDWAYRHNWELRPGMAELLAGTDLPMAVVSNTLSGAAHRDFLTAAGVAKRFAVQIYSDEAGVRKPNPQMIWNATDELGVAPQQCWFVGDSRRRDVACARRADAGKAILMRSPRTDREDPARWPEPDVLVEDGFELLALLTN